MILNLSDQPAEGVRAANPEVSPADLNTASDRSRRSALAWWLWFLGVLTLAGLLGVVMLRQEPGPSLIAWLVLALGASAIIYQPRYGLYLIVFFGLAGDLVLWPWYPFIWDFSSAASLLFVNNSVIFSPLEVYIVLTCVSWLARAALQRRLKIHTGPLFWPAVIFLAFTIFGLGYGLATGGNANIALWEARPIFYFIALFFLAGNLLQKREHVNHLLGLAMLALLIVGVAGDLHYFVDLKGNLAGIESITEHGTAVQINTVFIFALGAGFTNTPAKRQALLLMIPIVMVTYIATQRRAAVLALIVAVILAAFLLLKENRRLFWMLVPATALIALVYGALFWNSSSKLALPVEAVKSVVFQNQATARDQSSDNYRLTENYDIFVTIRLNPLTGVGFGKQFYMVEPLPDISFFAWWQYITHNSILWIWMKTGAAGFLSMIFLIGYSIMLGTQVLLQLQDHDLRVAAFVATLYVVMHFTYAYVDMSWDDRSMIYVGAMMGLINCLNVIAARPISVPRNRWPWQSGKKLLPLQKPEIGALHSRL